MKVLKECVIFLSYLFKIGQQIQQVAQQVVTSTTTNNGGLLEADNSIMDSSSNNDEGNEPTYQREIALAVGIILLASIAPPPLKLFPPNGLPQPGILSAGGGATPSSILGVDDQPCEDIRYQGICQELIFQNRVLFEENCRSPG